MVSSTFGGPQSYRHAYATLRNRDYLAYLSTHLPPLRFRAIISDAFERSRARPLGTSEARTRPARPGADADPIHCWARQLWQFRQTGRVSCRLLACGDCSVLHSASDGGDPLEPLAARGRRPVRVGPRRFRRLHRLPGGLELVDLRHVPDGGNRADDSDQHRLRRWTLRQLDRG